MRILHLISGGDTGGAKTHILTLLGELSKTEDVRLGVFLEDVFLEEARRAGIRTEVFLQQSRFDLSVVKSIHRYIRQEGIELVHCHGARANFIAYFLRRKTDIPFLTTVHSDYRLDFKGVFYKQLIFKNLNFLALRKFRHFIAVSDSFREMLEGRGFRASSIDVVYNGVAMDQPMEAVSPDDFFARYGICPKGTVFGILARLEEVKDHRTFLKAASIFAREHEATFLIGGEGNERASLVAYAEELGLSGCVHFLGDVKDPFSFLQAIDVNVLTSESESFPYVILEGARLSRPMVATAVGGIPRLVEDRKTGRLFSPGDAVALARIFEDLSSNPKERTALGAALHEAVRLRYSAKAMAEQHMEIYCRILSDKSVVLSGFYGFDNQGDDAILAAIVSEFRRIAPGIRPIVLSNNPEKTRRIYGVDSVYRFSPPKIWSALHKSDMLLSGGGSLLQDVTSSRSLWYYLFVIALSKKLGKKTVIFANGVGPIRGRWNRKLTRRILRRADFISLRDADSAETLRRMGLPEEAFCVRADPVFLLEPQLQETDQILERLGLEEGFIAVNLRPWKGQARFLEEAKKAVLKLLQSGKKVLLLPMYMAQDLPMLTELRDAVDHPGLHLLEDEISVEVLMGILQRASLVVAMRLHGLIYSASVGTPPVAISYDPKVDGLMKEIESPYILSVDTLSAEALMEMIRRAEADVDYPTSLLEGRERRKALARQNIREVLDLMGVPDEDQCARRSI